MARSDVAPRDRGGTHRGRLPGRLRYGGMRNPVRRAITKAGGFPHVGAVLKVSQTSLFQWIRWRKVPLTHYAVLLAHLADMEIAELSGVTARDIRRTETRQRLLAAS